MSLLNLDLKIITKIFATSLYSISSSFLSAEQLANPPGRGEFNSLLIKDALLLAEMLDDELYVLDLDFKKAFDMVSHEFLWLVLKKSGMPESFVRFIQMLYSKATSRIKVNGFKTEIIKIANGVRQGCALSVLLFFLCVQPLINVINSTRSIQGYTIQGRINQVKISQYSDNSTLLLKNTSSIKNAIIVIKSYEEASGGILSLEKSYAIPAGRAKVRLETFKNTKFGNLNWCTHRQILGVWHANTFRESHSLNTQEAINEFLKFVTKYIGHAQNMFGAAVLINAIGYAQFWHRVRIYPLSSRCVDQLQGKTRRTLKVINDYTCKMIWSTCKGAKISRLPMETLIRPIKDGGIGLINFKAKVEAFQVKPIIDFLQDLHFSETPEMYPHLSLKRFMLGTFLKTHKKLNLSRPHKESLIPAYKNALTSALEVLEILHKPGHNYKYTLKMVYSVINRKTETRLDLLDELRFLNPDIRPQIISAFSFLKPRVLQPQIKNNTYNCIYATSATTHYLMFVTHSDKCSYHECGRHTLDTLFHFFIGCPEIYALRTFVEKQMRHRCNHRLKLDEITLRFGNRDQNHLLMVILAIYREITLSVKHTRILSTHHVRTSNENQIIRFKNTFTKYIQTEFTINERSTFIQRYIGDSTFIEMENNSLEILWP